METAHRGTLFLDEVGEMPPPMQVKLLRFLQEGTFVPVGGRVQKRAEVRIIAATHRDLGVMVADGSFREDFYYRLRGMVLRTLALAERTDDVALLAARFLRHAAPRARLTADATAHLAARAWPGNVREQRSLIETAGALASPETDLVDKKLSRLGLRDVGEGCLYLGRGTPLVELDAPKCDFSLARPQVQALALRRPALHQVRASC